MAKISDNIEELKTRLRLSPDFLSLFFFGSEDYLKDYYLSEIRQKYVKDDALDHLIISAIDGNMQAISKLSDAVSMPSMCGSTKLIEMHEIQFAKLKNDEIKALAEAIDTAKEYGGNIIVIYATNDIYAPGAKPENDAIYKAFSKFALPVWFDLQSDAKLVPWIVRHMAKEKIEISANCAEELIAFCGHNMRYRAGELEKLIVYLKSKQKQNCESDDIYFVCSPNEEYSEFAYQNAITSFDCERALLMLKYKKENGEDASVPMAQLLGVLGDMLKVKLAVSSDMGVDNVAISQKLSMHEYRVKLYISSVRQISLRSLLAAYKMCYNATLSQRQNTADPYGTVETLICRILPGIKKG